MGRQQGHAQQVGKDRWRLYAEAAPDPVTGKRRKKSITVTATSSREAHQLLAGHVVDVASGRWDRGPGRNVDQALDAWLEHHVAEPNTIDSWRRGLALYIRPHIGDVPLERITPEVLERLYRQLQLDGGHDGRPLSASTVRKVHTPLRLALAQAVRWQWIPTNPAVDAKAPTVRAATVEPPSVDDVAHLVALADAHDPDWSTAIRVLAHTGIRRGELCGLRWDDVDLDARELAVHRVVKMVGTKVLVTEYAKTASSSRRIGLGPAVVTRLRQLRTAQLQRLLAAGWSRDDAGGFVFSNDLAGRAPWNPQVISHRFGRLRKRAGLQRVRAHDLRHFMATRWLSEGVDVRTVAGRGGWANPSTLLSTYAHWVPARDREAASRLDDVG